jgi:LysM repeat protein
MQNPIEQRPLATGLLVACLLSASLLTFMLAFPVLAAPSRQVPIFTPTPGTDGRIIYIVKANDTLLSISLLTGVPVDQLRALNGLTGDTIIEGQPLLLGLAGPPEVVTTPGPSPTPTPLLPTPTAKPGSGNLCILLFNDRNGDSIRQEEEPSIPDGEVSVSDRSGSVSLTTTTEGGTDPYCFNTVPEGDYNISVAVPAGFNPTTVTNYALSLKAGDETFLDFGAQANSETLAEAPIPAGSGRSPILGIVGGLFLLVGVGLAVFAGRLLRGK